MRLKFLENMGYFYNLFLNPMTRKDSSVRVTGLARKALQYRNSINDSSPSFYPENYQAIDIPQSYQKNLYHLFSIPKPPLKTDFPTLPVIEALINKALPTIESDPLKKTAIIYIHHPLQTSFNLIDAIIRLGADPKNIFILGKNYSECLSVVEQMVNLGVHYQACSTQIGLGKFSQSFIRDINWLWLNVISHLKKNVKEIIVLDHGGHALDFIPTEILRKYKIVGVEKTTAGLINLEAQGLLPLPLIGVANCAAKRILESPLIANAIVNKILPLIPIKNGSLICGVVGYGAIGKALVEKLLSMGHEIVVYDHGLDQLKIENGLKDVKIMNKLSELISSSDYIFGCTGRDISTSIDHFKFSDKDKTLVSCSSEDKEFLSLLYEVQKKESNVVRNPFNNIEYKTDLGATIRILRGGFPINFDNSGESVPANDIQLTRALVLGSILQAIQFFKNPDILNMGGIYALDPSIQKFIVDEWIKYQPVDRFSKDALDKFQTRQSILEHSGGTYQPCNPFGSDCLKPQDQGFKFN